MKLVLAVVHTKDADTCIEGLTSAGFVCTRFNSFGGFLDKENVTLLCCVDNPRVEEVMEVLRSRARRRHETVETGTLMAGPVGMLMPAPMDVEIGGATVFVLDVDRFEKL